MGSFFGAVAMRWGGGAARWGDGAARWGDGAAASSDSESMVRSMVSFMRMNAVWGRWVGLGMGWELLFTGSFASGGSVGCECAGPTFFLSAASVAGRMRGVRRVLARKF